MSIVRCRSGVLGESVLSIPSPPSNQSPPPHGPPAVEGGGIVASVVCLQDFSDSVLLFRNRRPILDNVTSGGQFLTSAEASDLVGLTQRTFNRRVAAGVIVPTLTLPGPKGPRLFDRAYIEGIAAEMSAA